MTRACAGCGKPYSAKSARSRFCSQACQKRAWRTGGERGKVEQLHKPNEHATKMLEYTRRDLAAAGMLETKMGEHIIRLTEQFGDPYIPASAMVAVSKELLRLWDAINVEHAPPDILDEMRARRDAKAARAAATREDPL